jgi:hypothetical protein
MPFHKNIGGPLGDLHEGIKGIFCFGHDLFLSADGFPSAFPLFPLFPFSFPESIILSPSCQLVSTSPCNSEIPDSSFESQHRSTAALSPFRIPNSALRSPLTFPSLRPTIRLLSSVLIRVPIKTVKGEE